MTFFDAAGQERPALEAATFTLARGTLAFVLGHNGSGKSTLLRALGSGVVTSGTALLGDMSLVDATASARAARVVQLAQHSDDGLILDFTVEENLTLAAMRGRPATLRRASTDASRGQAETVLAAFGMGLERRLRTRVSELSGGERQAVATATALVGRPAELALFDEPTSATDARVTTLIERVLVQAVRHERMTVLWVSHDLAPVVEHADVALILRGGRLADIMDRHEIVHGGEREIRRRMVTPPQVDVPSATS